MKIENMSHLSEELTRREGGKVNLSIAQVKEVLAHLSDIIYSDDPSQVSASCNLLYENGKRRHKKNKEVK